MISFIIPTYNESSIIENTLTKLLKVTSEDDEAILVDGSSEDSTLEKVKKFPRVKIIESKQRGRGFQMNLGAEKAVGDYLLFLHADTVVDRIGIIKLKEAVNNHKVNWGWFDLKLDSPKIVYRVLETLAQYRIRLISEPLGDHGIFVKKEIFEKVGGYPEISIMEDVEFVKKLKAISKGTRINHFVESSVRRFENCGVISTSFKMIMLRTLYFFGVSTNILSSYYNPER